MSRAPNELEAKLHSAILHAPQHELSIRQIESITPDPTSRQNALNFLLRVNLIKASAGAKGAIASFRAVSKAELELTKGLTDDENMVLTHIKASGSEGLWTKQIKTKTNLHQVIVDKCLKSLTQKALIKRVQSVQYPTRKIYMLYSLEPSVSLTGGPWYTDNELDTEFIKHLTDACLKFIRDLTIPKRNIQGRSDVLYSLKAHPNYPSAHDIKKSLRKARLTETELSVEHVEMLLNVLVLDGEIEKIPNYAPGLWQPDAIDKGESSDEKERRHKKKRKQPVDNTSDEEVKPPKRKKKKKVVSSDSSDPGSESEDEPSSYKKSLSNRKKVVVEPPTDTGTSSSEERRKRRKSKKKRKRDDSGDDSDNTESDALSIRKKKKKKPRKEHSNEDSKSSSSNPDSDEPRSRKSHKKPTKRQKASPELSGDDFVSDTGAWLYRAVKQDNLSFGWTESPCSKCPSFEFCKQGGPANPTDCIYYSEWLTKGTVATLLEGV